MKRQVTAALSFTLLFGAACGSKAPEAKKDPAPNAAAATPKPEEAKPAEPKPAVAPVEPTPAAVPAGVPAALADVAKYTPAGTEVALYVDFTKVKTGPLWTKFGPLLEGAAGADAEYQEFVKAAGGWDPLKNITGLYIAAKKIDDVKPEVLIILKGSYDAAALTAAIKADGNPEEAYNGTTLYKTPDSEFYFGLPAAGVMLVGSPEAAKNAIDMAAKPAFEGQAQLLEVLGSADATKSVFGSMVLTQQMKDQASAMGDPNMKNAVGAFFSIDATTGFEIKGGLRFTDPAGPTALKAIADKALADQMAQAEQMGFGEFAKKLTIEAKDKDLVYSWALNAEETMKLVEMAMGMAAGMMPQ